MNSTNDAIATLRSAEYYITTVGRPISICTGLIGNTLAIITLIIMRQTNGVYYLIALSLADLSVLVVWSVLWLQEFFRPLLIEYYDWACRLVFFGFYSSLHCSVSLLVSMTAERFVVVWFPIKAKTICKKKHSLIVIVVVISLILSLNLHNLFTRQVLDNGNGTTFCLTSWSVMPGMPYDNFHLNVWPWIDSTIYAFFPVISIFILNSLIITKVRLSGNMTGKNTKETKSQNKQITKTLLIVSFTFLILTLPICIVLIVEKNWDFFSDPYQFAVWLVLRAVSAVLELTNHSVNFFLYCLGGKRFREEFLRLMFRCCKRPGVASSDQSSHQRNSSRISRSSKTVDTDVN